MAEEKDVDLIVSKIKDAVQPEKIYLFGSYAHGSPNANSDLDLCLIKNNFRNKQEELAKARKSIWGINMPIDLLLFDEKGFASRKDLWGSVQYEIFHNGKIVYER